MSQSDNLESLSNAELRAQCMEYGLPNIPITDTSRSVIIKRLRMAINGTVPGLSPAKKPSRRETIAAVTGVSTANENIGDGRGGNRRTINTAVHEENTSKIPGRRTSTSAAQAPAQGIGERRRSIRASPVPKSTLSAPKEAERKRLSPIIIDSDDEEEVVNAVEQVEKRQTRRSTSRQPSLSRTSTVKTNYSQDLGPLAEEAASFVKDLQGQDAVDTLKQDYLRKQQEAEEEEKKMRQLQQQKLERERYLYHKQQLEQQQQQLKQQKEQIEQERYLLQKRQEEQQQQEILQQQQLQQQQKQLQQEEKKILAKADERLPSFTRLVEPSPILPQKTTQFGSSTLSTASTLSNASTRYSAQPLYQRPSNLYPTLETVDSYSRGSLGYSSAVGSRVTSYNEFSDDTETELAKDDFLDEKYDTPFLSNFARNLNRLKTEPSSEGSLSRRFTRSRTAHEVKGRLSTHSYGQQEERQSWLQQQFAEFMRPLNLLGHFLIIVILFFVVYYLISLWK